MRRGHDIVGEAADGWTAVHEIARLRTDVVLLDIHLPDIDGFQVARMVRENERRSIVLISSRHAEEFGEQIRASGSRGFLAKADLSPHTLEAIIGDND